MRIETKDWYSDGTDGMDQLIRDICAQRAGKLRIGEGRQGADRLSLTSFVGKSRMRLTTTNP